MPGATGKAGKGKRDGNGNGKREIVLGSSPRFPNEYYTSILPYLPVYKSQLQHQFFTSISGGATYIPNAPFFLDYKSL